MESVYLPMTQDAVLKHRRKSEQSSEYALETETLLHGEDTTDRSPSAASKRPRYWMMVVLLAMISSGLTIAFLNWNRSSKWNECGSTPAEARANNCHFDPMMRAWIPDACFYHEPLDEYDPFHDREWFLDWKLTKPADIDVLVAGEGPHMVYTKDYHTEHCLYVWRKLGIAIDQKRPFVDNKTYGLGHSRHCSLQIAETLKAIWNKTDAGGALTETDELRLRKVGASLDYYSCVPLQWDITLSK